MSESQKELEALLAEVVKSTNEDKDYGAIKASINLLPVIGSPAAEFFSTYVTSPSQKRLEKFLEELIKELRKLETQVNNFRLESLQEDETFATMLMQSLEIARRSHQAEKLKALKNLLLNSVLQNSISDDVKLLFLDWIDQLKDTHLYLLDVLNNPEKHMEKDSELNNLKEHPYLYDVFLKELIDKKIVALAKISNSCSEGIIENYLRTNQPEEAIRALLNRIKDLESLDIHLVRGIIRLKIPTRLITPLGKLFIDFIKSPLKDDPQQ
jgi:hypothetical protein